MHIASYNIDIYKYMYCIPKPSTNFFGFLSRVPFFCCCCCCLLVFRRGRKMGAFYFFSCCNFDGCPFKKRMNDRSTNAQPSMKKILCGVCFDIHNILYLFFFIILYYILWKICIFYIPSLLPPPLPLPPSLLNKQRTRRNLPFSGFSSYSKCVCVSVFFIHSKS